MHEWRRRQGQAHESWRWFSNMHEKKKNNNEDETKIGRIEREKKEYQSSIAPLMEMFRSVSEKNWEGKQWRQQQQRKDARRKGKRKQHIEQNEALCHEQHGERKQIYVFTFSWKKDDGIKKERNYIHHICKNFLRSMHSTEKSKKC